MIPLLTKPVDKITAGDIHDLINSRVPESERIEFKRELPTSGARSWEADETICTDAKNQILKEVVAFANAYGGALVLGIEEGADSDTEPPVAGEIRPVPQCAELATRFRTIFRDRIEPQIPRLEIFHLETDGTKGVVVFRVPRSRLAPHGIRKKNKAWTCPVRRWDRCEEMSMREIQDMTLNVTRGLQRLDNRFQERAASFERQYAHVLTPDKAIGIRMTALPVDSDVSLDRVYNGRMQLTKELEVARPLVTVTYKWPKGSRTLAGGRVDRMGQLGWKPVLRGARTRQGMDHLPPSKRKQTDTYYYLELARDGLVEFGWIGPQTTSLVSDHLVVAFARVVCWTDVLRRHAGAALAEYVVDVHVRTTGTRARLLRGARTILPEDYVEDTAGILPRGPTPFPRYSFTTNEQIDEVVTQFQDDLCNAAELNSFDHPLIVDYTSNNVLP